VGGLIGGGLKHDSRRTVLQLGDPFSYWPDLSLGPLPLLVCRKHDDVRHQARRGVKDYGTLVAASGRARRIDSLCFAAPVFFHIVKSFFTT